MTQTTPIENVERLGNFRRGWTKHSPNIQLRLRCLAKRDRLQFSYEVERVNGVGFSLIAIKKQRNNKWAMYAINNK